MNLVRASLKYPQVTLPVLLLLFAIGVNSLLHMPRREDPKITIRQGLIIAFYPGANSAQVEDQVTKKLEQYLFQYEEVRKEKTWSTSRDGAMVINVELEESVKNPDIFWNKLRHEMLLAKNLDLPAGVVGPIVNSDFGDTEAMVIGIECDDVGFTQLKEYAQKLEDGLRTIPAVSKIKRIGEQDQQIEVSSNSAKLSQYGVHLSQAIKILQSQNSIDPTGDLKTQTTQVPLYTNGYYSTEAQIASQIIGASPTGEIIHLGDVATVQRKYQEPTQEISVNGHKSVILAVEMHEGNNIVEFGQQVRDKLTALSALLPANVNLTTIVNQPAIVDENISHFIREFFLAIISVVVVVVLLLPFRIAAVAATAIPMTIAVTFALMHTFGIELHQVSLAALIVVLGMVVDDAIVIADNYVELLDEGVDRHTAAWRSASDMLVPVLTATITIIAAFMPMVILTGSVGEFIVSLPVTVTIALASSFIVAMVLTPLLCYHFIKKGLHTPAAGKEEGVVAREQTMTAPGQKPGKLKRKSLLDGLQKSYDAIIVRFMRRPVSVIAVSLFSVVLAAWMYTLVPQKFFPAAERNQFVVEIWMPTGTKLDATRTAMLKVEQLIRGDSRVTTFAGFAGTSAPRFYYNFSPEFPVTNYAEILVNTTTNATAESLAEDLSRKVDSLVPEGRPDVKLMQQGSPTIAPVEIRVIGNDLDVLADLGAQVAGIVKAARGSRMVRSDFREDYYGIHINLKDAASRLGFTTGSVSQMVYTGFSGAPVSTMYEGNNPVSIVLRLDEQNRQNARDLDNMYVSSPATGAVVPLRQIADLEPGWQKGRIMHRNGNRTLTVLSETTRDVLPSELLGEVRPGIEKIPLPAGYHIEYGGEYENKNETFSQMIVALLISLFLIFFILLFQFRDLKETALVMLTIPLSMFGAMAGLLITHNEFGFTAFVGLISLSGIVVRNAIILIDHTNVLLKQGMDIPTAAMEAGKRRLRPIFLTAMAAAIGVLPMILSGSPMWSPLASVIAVGVIWGMIMALLVVPVLYAQIMKPKDKIILVQN